MTATEKTKLRMDRWETLHLDFSDETWMSILWNNRPKTMARSKGLADARNSLPSNPPATKGVYHDEYMAMYESYSPDDPFQNC